MIIAKNNGIIGPTHAMPSLLMVYPPSLYDNGNLWFLLLARANQHNQQVEHPGLASNDQNPLCEWRCFLGMLQRRLTHHHAPGVDHGVIETNWLLLCKLAHCLTTQW